MSIVRKVVASTGAVALLVGSMVAVAPSAAQATGRHYGALIVSPAGPYDNGQVVTYAWSGMNPANAISDATGLPRRSLAEDAIATLQVHDWPGNVRQLRNNIERLLILATGDPAEAITAQMLPSEVASSGHAGSLNSERIIALPLRDAREVFEREYLNAQIMRFGGKISRTASFIGMERSALHRKLKSLGLTTLRASDEEEEA